MWLNAAALRSRCHDGKVVTVAVNGDVQINRPTHTEEATAAGNLITPYLNPRRVPPINLERTNASSVSTSARQIHSNSQSVPQEAGLFNYLSTVGVIPPVASSEVGRVVQPVSTSTNSTLTSMHIPTLQYE